MPGCPCHCVIIIAIVAFFVVNPPPPALPNGPPSPPCQILSHLPNKTTISELGLIRLLLQVLLQQWNVMKMSDNRIYHSKCCIIWSLGPAPSREGVRASLKFQIQSKRRGHFDSLGEQLGSHSLIHDPNPLQPLLSLLSSGQNSAHFVIVTEFLVCLWEEVCIQARMPTDNIFWGFDSDWQPAPSPWDC